MYFNKKCDIILQIVINDYEEGILDIKGRLMDKYEGCVPYLNTSKPVRNIISLIFGKEGFELEECKVYSETWF